MFSATSLANNITASRFEMQEAQSGVARGTESRQADGVAEWTNLLNFWPEIELGIGRFAALRTAARRSDDKGDLSLVMVVLYDGAFLLGGGGLF